MKFLCLHGTDTNVEVLKLQLAPLTHPLSLSAHTFTYLPGPIPSATGFPGLDPSIPGPFYRYYDRTQIDMDIFTEHFHDPSPSTSTPEDRIRQMRALGLEHRRSKSARDYVMEFAERSEEGPFDGVIAFSEGSAVAADVVLEQQRRRRRRERKEAGIEGDAVDKDFKVAVFLCGAPAWDYQRQRYLLKDENEERIRIPTVSIVGAKDQMKPAGTALYDICEREGGMAGFYEHPGGHVVPGGLMGKKAMVGKVRLAVRLAEEREAEAKRERERERERKEAESRDLAAEADMGRTGSETSNSSAEEGSGVETESLEGDVGTLGLGLGKNIIKKTDLGRSGMQSEWEDVVDMIC